MSERNKLLFGLFFLRLGLGLFFLFVAIDKMINPTISVEKIALHYSFNISNSIAVLFGSCQLVFGLFFILGSYKNLTYLFALLMHIFTSFFWYYNCISFFGSQSDLFAHISLNFAFLTLFICKDFDTKFSLDKKRSLFS